MSQKKYVIKRITHLLLQSKIENLFSLFKRINLELIHIFHTAKIDTFFSHFSFSHCHQTFSHHEKNSHSQKYSKIQHVFFCSKFPK